MNKSTEPKDEKAMRVAYLIAGFVNQTLTPDEHEELDNWVDESDENRLLFEELIDENYIEAGIQQMKEADTIKAYERLRPKLNFNERKKRRMFWPYAVAASLILIAISIYFLMPFGKKQINSPVAIEKEDVQPGSDKAVLTLANGKKIVLENESNGNLFGDSVAKVVKLDSGAIAYEDMNMLAGKMEYNVLTTPVGGQYKVTLSDGTKIWLNATSSLRFPVAFIGNERVIELTGEAYLEVAANKAKPFYVRSKGQEIKVLGTKFNVNAYSDEEVITTTLVEGRIQLSTVNNKQVLKAGEGAIVNTGGAIQLNTSPDTETALAWVEGQFKFKNEPIEKVLKQLSRWYGVQVIYEGTINHHFNADISRKLPVSKILELLEKTERVHFQLKNKTVTVRL